MSPVSGKLGLAPVSHTLNNSCDLVLRDQHRCLLQHCIESVGFLTPLLYVQKCHRHVKIVDGLGLMSELTSQVNAHNIAFAGSSEVCSGIVILGLVLSLVFAQKSRTTDLNTSSMYN